MADSNISIVGLQATGGVNQIVLQWAVNDPNVNGLPYFRFDAAEIWASSALNMVDEAKIGEAATAFVHLPLSRGDKRYYRIRPRDLSGRLGDFTNIVNATEISGDVLLETNGYERKTNGLIQQWGRGTTGAGGVVQVNYLIHFPHNVLGHGAALIKTSSFFSIFLAVEIPQGVQQSGPFTVELNSAIYFMARTSSPGLWGTDAPVAGQGFIWQAIGF